MKFLFRGRKQHAEQEVVATDLEIGQTTVDNGTIPHNNNNPKIDSNANTTNNPTTTITNEHVNSTSNNTSSYGATSSSSPAEEQQIIVETVVEPTPIPLTKLQQHEQKVHERLKRIYYWMDESVTINGRQIGLDPIIGLIPFVGDFSSAVISLYFVARASPVLSKYTVIRMLTNVWIDSVFGTVPIIGDYFDMGWKANQRNLAIFEDHMSVGGQARRDTDRVWVLRIVLAGIIIYILTMVAIVLLVIYLYLYFSGRL